MTRRTQRPPRPTSHLRHHRSDRRLPSPPLREGIRGSDMSTRSRSLPTTVLTRSRLITAPPRTTTSLWKVTLQLPLHRRQATPLRPLWPYPPHLRAAAVPRRAGHLRFTPALLKLRPPPKRLGTVQPLDQAPTTTSPWRANPPPSCHHRRGSPRRPLWPCPPHHRAAAVPHRNGHHRCILELKLRPPPKRVA